MAFRVGANHFPEDTIYMTKTPTDSDRVVITLSADPSITWWKGICKGQWEMLSTQDDRRGPSSGTFSKGDLEGAGLWKAKVFGVHTYMYELTVEGGFVNGNEYHFTWKKD